MQSDLAEKNIAKENTLAFMLLSSNWFAYFFPSAIFVACWKAQLVISLLVGMKTSGGFFIIYLSRGVTFVSILIYGYKAVIGLICGVGVYFAIFPEPFSTESSSQAQIQNIGLTLLTYFCFEVYKFKRKLNDFLDQISLADILLIMGISQLVCSIYMLLTAEYDGDVNQTSLFLYQFLGSMIGCLVVFYTTIHAFTIFERVRLKRS